MERQVLAWALKGWMKIWKVAGGQVALQVEGRTGIGKGVEG